MALFIKFPDYALVKLITPSAVTFIREMMFS